MADTSNDATVWYGPCLLVILEGGFGQIVLAKEVNSSYCCSSHTWLKLEIHQS
jgi:hypothetical protein